MPIIFIPCLVGFLGFIISGLAFVSGTVSLKATDNLYKQNKIIQLESIFFTFYFLGMLTGIDIFLFVTALLVSMASAPFNSFLTFIISCPVSYLTFFIVFYSIGLLDTCIKIFFVNFEFNDEQQD